LLPPVPPALLRVRRDDDSGLGAVDSGRPRALLRLQISILVLRGVLTEVPEVPRGVLRVPVVRVLQRLAVPAHAVVDDARLDSRERLRLVRDGHVDALRLPVVDLAVDPGAAGARGPGGGGECR